MKYAAEIGNAFGCPQNHCRMVALHFHYPPGWERVLPLLKFCGKLKLVMSIKFHARFIAAEMFCVFALRADW